MQVLRSDFDPFEERNVRGSTHVTALFDCKLKMENQRARMENDPGKLQYLSIQLHLLSASGWGLIQEV